MGKINNTEHTDNPHEVSREQYVEELSKHISSQIDKKEILNRKDHLQQLVFSRIDKRKKDKQLRLTILSAAASLLILFSLGYYFQDHRSVTTEMAWTEISTPKGVRDSILLTDGSKIFLNGGSSLKYPLQFSGETRNVIFDGEGYFDITSNPQNPFLISTGDVDVRVLGTKFNLKAYSEDISIETTLEEGRVLLSHLESKQSIEMTPDHRTVFNKLSNTFSTDNVDGKIASMWRTGKYFFHSTPFLDMVQSLERGFGVTFIIEDKEVANKQITTEFRHGESIDEILKILELGSRIKYRKENNIIVIE